MRQIDFRGIALIEVLLATAIFSLFVTAIVGAIVSSQQGLSYNSSYQRADLIAKEGIAAVRAVRDQGFGNLVDGNHGLSSAGGSWVLSGSSDELGSFTRQVNISTQPDGSKKVISTVSWQASPQRQASLQRITYLTNWRVATSVGQPVFRAIEYDFVIPDNQSIAELILDQPLVLNYFVLVNGADGSGTSAGSTGPDDNYVRLVADPFASGDLSSSGDPATLVLERGSNGFRDWQGTITVVECLALCESKGFELVDVAAVPHLGSQTSGSLYLSKNWSDIGQVSLFGGYKGSGCQSSEGSLQRFASCHVAFSPGLTGLISWSRSTHAGLGTATSTVMAVEWGSEWTVQRRVVSGASGGQGANNSAEYDGTSIQPVLAENTWVWGSGWTRDDGIGDSAAGSIIVLGDGESAPTGLVNTVSVGQEYPEVKNFTVYALTHPDLTASYHFKPDGDSGDTEYSLVVPAAVAGNERFSQIYNSSNGTGTAFPRPIWRSIYTDSNQLSLLRRMSGQNWVAWVQAVDLSGINQ